MFAVILHSFVVVVDDDDDNVVVVVHGSGGPLDALENPMRVAVVLGVAMEMNLSSTPQSRLRHDGS